MALPLALVVTVVAAAADIMGALVVMAVAVAVRKEEALVVTVVLAVMDILVVTVAKEVLAVMLGPVWVVAVVAGAQELPVLEVGMAVKEGMRLSR